MTNFPAVHFSKTTLNHGNWPSSLLAKATKASKGNLDILDATAGRGEDMFVLAYLGNRVTALERHPAIHAALEAALLEAAATPDLQPIAARITLSRQNALDYLREPSNVHDVIYLDPMFPERSKSALVKQPMRLLKHIVGDDADSDALLPLALQKAAYRVVVKRPRHAPYLAQAEPTLSLEGRSNRFDIYVNKKLP